MRTEVIKIDRARPAAEELARAGAVLAKGGLVGFPTETVYGVGANAANRQALQRLQQLKDRPADKPFTVHLGQREAAELFVPRITPLARRMMTKGWPGPLTLVLTVEDPSAAKIAERLSAEQYDAIYHEGTVGLRCPDDEVAQELLNRAGPPVVAASANLAGRAPPRDAAEALGELAGKIELLLDAGPTRYAMASTIVRVNEQGYEILRPGVYDERMLERLSRVNLLFVCTGNTCRSPMAEGFCRGFLAEQLGCRPGDLSQRGYGIASAGTMAVLGGRASDHAVGACRQRQIDIAGHVSQPLSVELIHQADQIFTMCEHHTETVLTMVPSARERTVRLDPAGDIADPMGGDETVYNRCAERIAETLRARLRDFRL